MKNNKGSIFFSAIVVCLLPVTFAACGKSPAPPELATPDLLITEPSQTEVPPSTTSPLPTKVPTPSPSATPTKAPTWAPPPPGPPGVISDQPCSSSNTAWIGTFGYGTNCLDETGWHSYPTSRFASWIGTQVESIVACADGNIWISETLGINVVRGTSWNSFEYPFLPKGLACDVGTGIWVAQHNAITHFDGSSWTEYDAEEIFNTDDAVLVVDAAIAPDGKVWFATGDGIASFDGNSWTVFADGNGLDKNYYFEVITVDDTGNVWAGHSTGLLMFDGTNWTSYEDDNLFQVKSMVVDPQGRLWVGTFADGVSMFDGQEWVVYNRANSPLSNDRVISLAADMQGRIWMGTEYGLNVFDGQFWWAYQVHTSGLLANEIHALAILGDGPVLPDTMQRLPGSLKGTILQGEDPVQGAQVAVCTGIVSIIHADEIACTEDSFSRIEITGEDGTFHFSDLPVGQYSVVFLVQGDDRWQRWKDYLDIRASLKMISILEDQETDLGAIDVSQ